MRPASIDGAERTDLPSVSIIVSNYNYGRFLRQCIDAALAQTHPVQVVVVDDGSSDDSFAVLESYGDRIVVVPQANLGQGAAINSGVRASTGDIVCIQDADDWPTVDRSAVVATAFVEHPEVDWLMHNMSVVDEGGLLKLEHMHTFTRPDRLLDDVIAFGDVSGNGGGLCFRRSFFDRIGPVPTGTFRTGADAYLLNSSIFRGRALTLDEPLAMRREHGSSASAWSRPEARLSLGWIENRWQLSRRAAQLAGDAGGRSGLDTVASNRTWWQSKAELQRCKAEAGRDVRELVVLWMRFTAAVLTSRMPVLKKIVFVGRDTVLLLLPRRTYLLAWWVLHDGRPRVSQALERWRRRA